MAHPTDVSTGERAQGATAEHSPARPEVVIAYIRDALTSAATALPGSAADTAAALRLAAQDLPHAVSALGEAFDVTVTGEGLKTKSGPFSVLRGAASQAISSAQAAPNSEKLIYAGAKEKVAAAAAGLREFRGRVTAGFARAGQGLDKEPTPHAVAEGFSEVRAATLAEVKADVDAVLAEAEGKFEGGLEGLKRALINDALGEQLVAVLKTIEKINATLKVDTKLGATALGHVPKGGELYAALQLAKQLQASFGVRQLAELEKGRALFSQAGLMPTAQIDAQIVRIIRSYPGRLDRKLDELIQSWIAPVAPARRAPTDMGSGQSRGELAVATALKGLADRGLQGTELVAALRRQVAVRLDPSIHRDGSPLREANAAIDQLEEDLRKAGKL